MIRGISVLRTNVAPAVVDPVQWSANLQLAINNSQSLTILEPILPTIHQSIIPNAKTGAAVLDAKYLFDVKNVIHAETVYTWELRKFMNIEVTTYDEPLHFGKFADPLIVSHKWTAPLPYTKNSDIAILLNTSELLVLERKTVKSDYYTIKHNVFEILLQDLNLTADHFTDKGEIKITKQQLKSLKVTQFEYDVTGYLCLALADGSIAIYDLNLERIISPSSLVDNELGDELETIVKLSWSQWESNTSYISVITSSNSVILVTVQKNGDSLSITNKSLVKSASRFLMSKNQWTDDGKYLLIGDTINFHVYSVKTGSIVSYDHLQSSQYQLMTGTIVTNNPDYTLSIELSFEYGNFDQIVFNPVDNTIQRITSSKNSTLQKFVKQLLYKYQVSNSANIDDNKNNYSYLNETIEGTYINYGTQLNGQVIALVNRIVPKNVINYTILSKVDYQIDFIPVSSLQQGVEPPQFDANFSNVKPYTSVLSWINLFWFNYLNEIPQVKQIDGLNALKFHEEITAFLAKFKFSPGSALKPISNATDLETLVRENFIDDLEVFKLQLKYNLLIIIIKSLKVLYSKNNNQDLNTEILKLEQDVKTIIDIIFGRLGAVICAVSLEGSEDPFNNFLQQSYASLVSTDKMEIDDSASIAINTQFLAESFKVGGTSREEITSLSNHKWKRCNLTLLPILQLNHKTSELGGFDFIIDLFGSESWVVKGVLKYFDFCIYSGNRTFKKK